MLLPVWNNFLPRLGIVLIQRLQLLSIHQHKHGTCCLCSLLLNPRCSWYLLGNRGSLGRLQDLDRRRRLRWTHLISSILIVAPRSSFHGSMPHRGNRNTSPKLGQDCTEALSRSNMYRRFLLLQSYILLFRLKNQFLIHKSHCLMQFPL